ncbi:hypothetical protein [Streptomyces sp. NPDC058614]|uniref:hypothetical protein n=1 Tax=Streptomyces sp. NPDC058614 TaxID=3346557 RepID=UPI0036519F36
MLSFTAGGGAALKAKEFADFDTGQAVYRITGIGAFTLGWNPGWYPDADHPPTEEILQVAYGTGPAGFDMTEAPVLFGVTLAGCESFPRRTVDTGQLRLRPCRLLVTAPVRVPNATARRATEIVNALLRHWLTQPWTPELRRAHELHCAPRALSRYGGLIAEYEQRMERLRRDHAYYIARADRATAVLQAGPIPAPASAPPHPFATTDTGGR